MSSTLYDGIVEWKMCRKKTRWYEGTYSLVLYDPAETPKSARAPPPGNPPGVRAPAISRTILRPSDCAVSPTLSLPLSPLDSFNYRPPPVPGNIAMVSTPNSRRRPTGVKYRIFQRNPRPGFPRPIFRLVIFPTNRARR